MSKKVLLLASFTLLQVFVFGQKNTAPMVGNDSDAHGCKASAGYQWSSLRNQCIRLFESGIRLEPKAAKLDKTSSAFIVFKSEKDESKVELFLSSSKKSVVLKKIGKDNAGTWSNKNYVLNQWKGMYSLENKNKKLLYQGMVQ